MDISGRARDNVQIEKDDSAQKASDKEQSVEGVEEDEELGADDQVLGDGNPKGLQVHNAIMDDFLKGASLKVVEKNGKSLLYLLY